MLLWDSIDEIEQAGTTIELRKEKGGISLCLRRVYPFKTWPNDTVLSTTFAKNATPITTNLHAAF